MIELHSIHALEALDHMNMPEANGLGLKAYQTKIIKSVIDLELPLSKIMIPETRIFSLKVTSKIDNKIARKLTKKGYSRIPVYEKDDKSKIIGILLIKTLIGIDLTEPKSIADLVNDGDVILRKPIFISPNEKAETLLFQFLMGKSHMAIISDNPKRMEDYIKGLEDYGGDMSLMFDERENMTVQNNDEEPAKIVGLLTLEDLIEYIIKEDILDEADYDKDLLINKNQNIKIESKLDQSIISNFLTENRSVIKEIVDKEVETNLKNRKFKFRPEYARPINLSFKDKDLGMPLLDRDSTPKYLPPLGKIEDSNKEHQA